MSERPRKPKHFHFHVELPSCFDEPMTFDLKEFAPATIEALASHECIGYANASPGQIWQFESQESGNMSHSLVVRSRIVTNNSESMRDAAIAGLGICVLPVFIAAKALVSGQLINALPTAFPVADTIYAVYPRNRHLPKKVRAVIDHLVVAFERELPWEQELSAT